MFSGYKMRKQISKAITRRSAAIRTALNNYNALAPLQKPPRPTLEFSEVASYAFLGDFEMLKYSRYEVMKKPWASAANREIATKYFKVVRAHEELHRLNVEIPRLAVWVEHEDVELREAAERLQPDDPHLAAEVRAYHLTRKRVNNVHRTRLNAIYKLEGYTGPRPANPVTQVPADAGPGNVDSDIIADLEGHKPIQADDDDTLRDELSRLGECLDSIHL
jgi:hypothetical protein